MEQSIKALKKYPNYSVSMIAKKTGIPSSELLRHQREYYRPFLKRDSPRWGMEGSVIK